MTYYDPTTLLPVETAAVEPVPPALGRSAGANALHPARRRDCPRPVPAIR
jgi:hypothetical protein